MASKHTKVYRFPQPQDSDIIDAKDISDGFQMVENELVKGIPIPELRDDGYFYLKGVNTGRKWKPEKEIDYFTPEEQQAILDYAIKNGDEILNEAKKSVDNLVLSTNKSLEELKTTFSGDLTASKQEALKAIKEKREELDSLIEETTSSINKTQETITSLEKTISEHKTAIDEDLKSINTLKGDIDAKQKEIGTSEENFKQEVIKAQEALKAINDAKISVSDTITQINKGFDSLNEKILHIEQIKTDIDNVQSTVIERRDEVVRISESLSGIVDEAKAATESANNAASKVLPNATKDQKGIVQVGDGIAVSSGLIELDYLFEEIPNEEVDRLLEAAYAGIINPEEVVQGLENKIKEFKSLEERIKKHALIAQQVDITNEDTNKNYQAILKIRNGNPVLTYTEMLESEGA